MTWTEAALIALFIGLAARSAAFVVDWMRDKR